MSFQEAVLPCGKSELLVSEKELLVLYTCDLIMFCLQQVEWTLDLQ